MKTRLVSILTDLSSHAIAFDSPKIIQYNLFDHSHPEDLTFNGFHSLLEYKKYLKVQYALFKKEFDRCEDSGNCDLDDFLLLIEELSTEFYTGQADGQDVMLHGMMYISAEHNHQITDIKLKVSGFLSAQKKNIGRNKKLSAV